MIRIVTNFVLFHFKKKMSLENKFNDKIRQHEHLEKLSSTFAAADLW